jgi:hypothetical protein
MEKGLCPDPDFSVILESVYLLGRTGNDMLELMYSADAHSPEILFLF